MKALKITALLEGISWIPLGITMYLKYFQENGFPNKVAGMIHGVLFVSYIILLLMEQKEKKWKLDELIILIVLAIIPFGTFYADKKYFK